MRSCLFVIFLVFSVESRMILENLKIMWCKDMVFDPQIKENVALVGVPSSGVTWLRYLLQQVTGVYTSSTLADPQLQKLGLLGTITTGVIAIDVRNLLHERGFSKAILLIRKPQDTLLALFNALYKGSAPAYAFEGLTWSKFVNVTVPNWSKYYIETLEWKGGPIHVVFYEKLVKKTRTTLKSILGFIGRNYTEDDMDCAMQNKKNPFKENTNHYNIELFTKSDEMQILKHTRTVLRAIKKYQMSLNVEEERNDEAEKLVVWKSMHQFKLDSLMQDLRDAEKHKNFKKNNVGTKPNENIIRTTNNGKPVSNTGNFLPVINNNNTVKALKSADITSKDKLKTNKFKNYSSTIPSTANYDYIHGSYIENSIHKTPTSNALHDEHIEKFLRNSDADDAMRAINSGKPKRYRPEKPKSMRKTTEKALIIPVTEHSAADNEEIGDDNSEDSLNVAEKKTTNYGSTRNLIRGPVKKNPAHINAYKSTATDDTAPDNIKENSIESTSKKDNDEDNSNTEIIISSTYTENSVDHTDTSENGENSMDGNTEKSNTEIILSGTYTENAETMDNINTGIIRDGKQEDTMDTPIEEVTTNSVEEKKYKENIEKSDDDTTNKEVITNRMTTKNLEDGSDEVSTTIRPYKVTIAYTTVREDITVTDSTPEKFTSADNLKNTVEESDGMWNVERTEQPIQRFKVKYTEATTETTTEEQIDKSNKKIEFEGPTMGNAVQLTDMSENTFGDDVPDIIINEGTEKDGIMHSMKDVLLETVKDEITDVTSSTEQAMLSPTFGAHNDKTTEDFYDSLEVSTLKMPEAE